MAAAALLETVDLILSPAHSQECDGQQAITHEELEEALKLMPRGKRPGNDGLPYELYKVFCAEIGDELHEVFLEAYNIQR